MVLDGYMGSSWSEGSVIFLQLFICRSLKNAIGLQPSFLCIQPNWFTHHLVYQGKVIISIFESYKSSYIFYEMGFSHWFACSLWIFKSFILDTYQPKPPIHCLLLGCSWICVISVKLRRALCCEIIVVCKEEDEDCQRDQEYKKGITDYFGK